VGVSGVSGVSCNFCVAICINSLSLVVFDGASDPFGGVGAGDPFVGGGGVGDGGGVDTV
jgi:hypothetical protein